MSLRYEHNWMHLLELHAKLTWALDARERRHLEQRLAEVEARVDQATIPEDIQRKIAECVQERAEKGHK